MKTTKPIFCIIGEEGSLETQDLLDAIKTKGYEAEVFPLRFFSCSFSNGQYIPSMQNRPVDQYDIYIFRAYNRNFFAAQILAEHLLSQGKVVIDEVLAQRILPTKLYEASRFTLAGIPHPITHQLFRASTYEKFLFSLEYPIIVKPEYGQKGQDVMKYDSPEEAWKFFCEHPRGFFIQEYVPADYDTRIIVIDGVPYGALRRFRLPHDFRTNASLGANAEGVALSPEYADLAIRACRAIGYEIAGVDIIEHNGKAYVLEVNATPQWQRFKECVGINPAKHIIQYAEKKYASS